MDGNTYNCDGIEQKVLGRHFEAKNLRDYKLPTMTSDMECSVEVNITTLKIDFNHIESLQSLLELYVYVDDDLYIFNFFLFQIYLC